MFRTDSVRKPLTDPIPGVGRMVEVDVTKEKGSDVNLASYLLKDGYDCDYEQAVIISNDSDLALPIQMVRDSLKLPAGVVNPSYNKAFPTANQLQDAATFLRRIQEKALAASQFPPTLSDKHGTISKLSEW